MTPLQTLCFDMISTARQHIGPLIAQYPTEAHLSTLCRHPKIKASLAQIDAAALAGDTHACKAGTKTLYRTWRSLLDTTCPKQEEA